MQGSPRNTGAYKSGAAEVDDEMRARAFEPSSRPDLLGGLLEARLSPNRGAGAPRTAVWRSAQQLKLLPQHLTGIKKAAPAHTARHRRSANTHGASAPQCHTNKEHGQHY